MQTWKERWLLPYRNTNYRIDEKNYYIFYQILLHKKVMRLIKQCDFFGHQFHFLINKHNTYQTFIGGVCSFVTVIALAIVTYFFGKPLWYHRS